MPASQALHPTTGTFLIRDPLDGVNGTQFITGRYRGCCPRRKTASKFIGKALAFPVALGARVVDLYCTTAEL